MPALFTMKLQCQAYAILNLILYSIVYKNFVPMVITDYIVKTIPSESESEFICLVDISRKKYMK